MLDDANVSTGRVCGEAARLDTLRSYKILDTTAEERFDAITRTAATLFRAPIALVSLVADDRQWFKSCLGLDTDGIPREHAFCAPTIETSDVLVVLDASRDPRFRDNPLVTSAPFIRFYAGAPLVTPDGHRLGSLCVVDRKPRRSFPTHDRRGLEALAKLVVDQMSLRRDELARAAATGLADAAELEALGRAFGRGEFVLHYQPQVCLRSGRLTGVEALIRWQHPERGLLLPGAFLPAIKTSALALPVGAWVLDEACRQMAAWRDAGLPIGQVGVNLFSAQFRAGDLAVQVLDALARHSLDPTALELEITERVALQNDDRVLDTVRVLHARGVRITFDDFGTGYASLSTLRRFPLTVLKIDRAFVADLLTDAEDAAITRAIIALSSELGLETVAEGIETAEQEAALRALGCKVGQGYRYGRAMPADGIAALALLR